MLDLAMLWKLTPTIERNPMQLVKVKGTSKRQKPITVLTMERFIALVRELPQPIDLIIFVTGNRTAHQEAHLPRITALEEFDFTQSPHIPATRSRLLDVLCH
jgi:hypothetical protein